MVLINNIKLLLLHYKMEINQLSGHPFEICSITNLYTDYEIDYYIQQIDEFSTKDNQFNTRDIYKKIKQKDSTHSGLIFSRIKHVLPEFYLDRKNIKWEIYGVSDYIFYSHIKENELIGIHSDNGTVYDPISNQYSKFTLLTYLTDDFVGGETLFYTNEGIIQITPEKNKTILFDIDLFHEGVKVLEGEKIWMKTEIVYRKYPSEMK